MFSPCSFFNIRIVKKTLKIVFMKCYLRKKRDLDCVDWIFVNNSPTKSRWISGQMLICDRFARNLCETLIWKYMYIYCKGKHSSSSSKNKSRNPDRNAWEIRKTILKQTAACLYKSIHVDLYLISFFIKHTWGLFVSQSG